MQRRILVILCVRKRQHKSPGYFAMMRLLEMSCSERSTCRDQNLSEKEFTIHQQEGLQRTGD
jgi:hypothetical protein